jgi:carboxyl-terminal processing protease
VLDLRLNPGGLLNSAVAVSSAFLPKNALVVYTDGRTEDAKMRLTASKENYVRGAFKEGLPEQAARVGEDGPDGRAGERRLGLRFRDRGGRAPGPITAPPSSARRLRQGLGADHPAAAEQPGGEAHPRRVYLHAGAGAPSRRRASRPTSWWEDAADARVLLREADLQHHLQGEDEASCAARRRRCRRRGRPATKPGTDKIIAAPVNTKTAAAAKAAAKGDAKSDKDKPADPNAKKEDLQLAAALNHLKGLPITATATANVAK